MRTASTHATQARLEMLNQIKTTIHPNMFRNLIEQFNLTVSPGQAGLLTTSEDNDQQATDAEDVFSEVN